MPGGMGACRAAWRRVSAPRLGVRYSYIVSYVHLTVVFKAGGLERLGPGLGGCRGRRLARPVSFCGLGVRRPARRAPSNPDPWPLSAKRLRCETCRGTTWWVEPPTTATVAQASRPLSSSCSPGLAPRCFAAPRAAVAPPGAPGGGRPPVGRINPGDKPHVHMFSVHRRSVVLLDLNVRRRFIGLHGGCVHLRIDVCR